MNRDLQAWEEDGGAAPESPGVPAAAEPVERKADGRGRPRCEVIAIDRWKNGSRKQIEGGKGG